MIGMKSFLFLLLHLQILLIHFFLRRPLFGQFLPQFLVYLLLPIFLHCLVPLLNLFFCPLKGRNPVLVELTVFRIL